MVTLRTKILKCGIHGNYLVIAIFTYLSDIRHLISGFSIFFSLTQTCILIDVIFRMTSLVKSIFALLTMFFMEGLWQFYMLNQNFFLNNIVDGWARWFDSVFVSFFILLVSFFITFSPHVSQWRTLDKIFKMRNKLSVTLIYDEKTSSNLQQYLSFV